MQVQMSNGHRHITAFNFNNRNRYTDHNMNNERRREEIDCKYSRFISAGDCLWYGGAKGEGRMGTKFVYTFSHLSKRKRVCASGKLIWSHVHRLPRLQKVKDTLLLRAINLARERGNNSPVMEWHDIVQNKTCKWSIRSCICDLALTKVSRLKCNELLPLLAPLLWR